MPTPFQQSVYDALMLIPKGKISTYKLLAEHLQCKSCQAIGQALRRNPYAPQVPCHRIIKSDLTIGGYSGATDGELLAKKLKYLEEEGIHFDREGKLLNSDIVFDFKLKATISPLD